MNLIEKIVLKVKILVSSFKKINLPINNNCLIDDKVIRHVYLIDREDIRLFFCIMKGKFYLIKHDDILERWLDLSNIEVRKSETMTLNYGVHVINNLDDYKEALRIESNKKNNSNNDKKVNKKR